MNYIGELLQPIRKATARNLADHEARVLRLTPMAMAHWAALEENCAYRKLAAHLIVQRRLAGPYLWGVP